MTSGGVAGVLLLASLLNLSGCAFHAPVIPPLGAVFSNTSAPLDLDLRGTDLGSRQGRAESTAILGLFAWGDASIAAGARTGGIKAVKHVDYNYFNVLGVYQRFTTIVHGD